MRNRWEQLTEEPSLRSDERSTSPESVFHIPGIRVPLQRNTQTREVKLVTVWTAETRDADGMPVRDPGSVSYTAAVESAASRDTDPLPSAVAQRAQREARRRGFDAAPRRVVLGDGAEWIWNLAGEQFPGAIEIVDLSTMPSSTCATWRRPSMAPVPIWPRSGPGTGVTNWTRDGSARSWRRCVPTRRPPTRRESASTT